MKNQVVSEINFCIPSKHITIWKGLIFFLFRVTFPEQLVIFISSYKIRYMKLNTLVFLVKKKKISLNGIFNRERVDKIIGGKHFVISVFDKRMV